MTTKKNLVAVILSEVYSLFH